MADLYYHHSGTKGEPDFKKTVFKKVGIKTFEVHLPQSLPSRQTILQTLYDEFPDGMFNVWGVPNGAQVIINRLKRGDFVLLIGALEQVEPGVYNGKFIAMCEVVAYWPEDLHELSTALWGEHSFPRVFVFRTELIELSWQDFASDMGFKRSYVVQGKFLSVSSDRVARLGGAEGYAKHLRSTKLKRIDPFDLPSRGSVASELERDETRDLSEIERELDKLRSKLSSTPQLKEASNKREQLIKRTARSSAFKLAVRKAYDHRCAICGISLYSPDGHPEVESAHIYPKALNGSDDIRNGLCLCRVHHWAFDHGCISISDDLKVLVNPKLSSTEEYRVIQDFKDKELRPPVDLAFAPAHIFLQAHRRLHGFE